MGWLIGLGWWLGLAGAVVAAAAVWWHIQRTPDRVLAAVGATDLTDASRLENLVEGLCLTNGITPPRLMVIDSSSRNILAVGVDEEGSALVVTRGLLDNLNRMELEGVVARQLWLIKHGDTAMATLVAAIAPLWSGLVDRLVASRIDVVADIEAVGLTRYPPGLVSALESIGEDHEVNSAPSWTRHLWIEDPGASAGGRPSTSHSPIDERLATLREL